MAAGQVSEEAAATTAAAAAAEETAAAVHPDEANPVQPDVTAVAADGRPVPALHDLEGLVEVGCTCGDAACPVAPVTLESASFRLPAAFVRARPNGAGRDSCSNRKTKNNHLPFVGKIKTK